MYNGLGNIIVLFLQRGISMGQTIFLHAQGCLFFGQTGCGLDENLHCEPCSRQSKSPHRSPDSLDLPVTHLGTEAFNDNALLVEGDL